MVVKRKGSLKKALQDRKPNGGLLRVGIINSATYPDGKSVAQVAFDNEFGTKKIPPRPFMRSTIAEKKAEWIAMVAPLVQQVGAEKAMLQLGEVIKGDIVFTILNLTNPPNAPSTIKKKGFDKPLVETAQLSRSLSYEFKTDGE